MRRAQAVQLPVLTPTPEIIAFRDMLSARAEASEPPLTEIPDDHKPVIAKLAFERCALAFRACDPLTLMT